MKDVFISHAWEDKKQFVEPLVVAIQAAGLSCWYDILEVQPGESLVVRLNEGLTSSKVILFCLSEGFLRGHWSQQELQSVAGLARLGSGIVRMVPLMLTDPDRIQRAYPVPFADLAYLRWDGDDLAGLAARIRAVVETVSREGGQYWGEHARSAWQGDDFSECVNDSRRSLEYFGDNFPVCILHVAALLRTGGVEEALSFIQERERAWEEMKEGDVDPDILNEVQDRLTAVDLGNEEKVRTLRRGLLSFLATEANGGRAWRHLARFFDRPGFEGDRERILVYAALQGRGEALDWIETAAEGSDDPEVRQALSAALYMVGSRFPELRPRIGEMALRFSDDESEEVRSVALIPCYYFAPHGHERVLRAVSDRAPEVRDQAIELLSGAYSMSVASDWSTEEGEPGAPDPLLTEEVVRRLLADPDDLILEEVVELISDGQIPLPTGVDLLSLPRPVSEEARSSEVRRLREKGGAAAQQRLLEIARDDPAAEIRSRAAEALAKLPLSISSEVLQNLYAGETVTEARDSLEELIVEKGDSSLVQVYLKILRKRLGTRKGLLSDAAEVLGRILESGHREASQAAVRLCRERGARKVVLEQAKLLVEKGLLAEARGVVEEGFAAGDISVELLLLVGRAADLDIALLEPWTEKGDPRLKIAALRALEWRRRDGRAVSMLHKLFAEELTAVAAGDGEAMWRSLDIADGVLETQGRREAVPMLERLYELINSGKRPVFPLRACWERLRILGIEKPEERFAGAEPAVPYPWPDRDGPFFGIASES